VNRLAEQFWGRNRSELLGRSMWNLVPETDETDLHAKLRNAAQGTGEQKFEAYSKKLERWVDISVYPAATGGMSIYFRDITERKRREENLAFLAEVNSELAEE
jgi:PAS domain S-box-containing protein